MCNFICEKYKNMCSSLLKFMTALDITVTLNIGYEFYRPTLRQQLYLRQEEGYRFHDFIDIFD